MSFTEAGPAHEDDIGLVLEKGEAEEILHVGAIDLLGPGPVELFEGFDHGEARHLDAALGCPILAPERLAFDQAAQKVQRRPVLLRRLLGQGLVVLLKIGEFEVKEVSVELIVFHRGVEESGWFLES